LVFVEIDKGYKINYIEKGTGKNLVFIHGFLGSSWLFEAQVEHFSKNYRVIAIDHIGHGKSDKPESESYELVELAQYLEKTLLKIIGNEKIILIGHSMGGMIAQIYATTPDLSKRLDGLVLMATAPKLKNPGLVRYIEELNDGTRKIKSDDSVNVMVSLCFNRTYKKADPELIEEFKRLTLENEEYVGLRTMNSIVENFNVEDKLKNISVPALMLAGEKDIFILPQESKLMGEKIPNSKVEIFPGKIGHMIQYEAKEAYTKALEKFFKSIY